MHRFPPPSIHDLLLPVIACLPTAFFSPKPPPALLPLLSPILRQRLSLLSDTTTSNSTSSSNRSTWLNLLTWSPARAARLNEICASLQLEPHPVSGELELFDSEDGTIEYRRLDSETLQAKCDIKMHDLTVIWTWCTNDTGSSESGTPQDGWRLAEVRPFEGTEEDKARRRDLTFQWYASQGEAEEAFHSLEETSRSSQAAGKASTTPSITQSSNGDDDDDDYWASYDRTPARTPAKHSPAPGLNNPLHMTSTSASTTNNQLNRAPSADELAYYARYGAEVQPALDAHDPDEAPAAEGVESSLHPTQSRVPMDEAYDSPGTATEIATARQSKDFSLPLLEPQVVPEEKQEGEIHSPRPSRPASPVSKLENEAKAVSTAEVGVKQHISTEMKSLYRLARASGIEREEFERVVRRELDVLGMLDHES